MENRLKPCPFCGGKAGFGSLTETWIECKKCRFETPYTLDVKQLIKRWNTRKPIEDIIEEIARRDTTDGTVKAFSGKEVIEIIKNGGLN